MADPKKAEAAASVKKTLVEEGTEFKGSLVSKCPVAVNGRVEGEVHAPSLTVAPSGGVFGKMRIGQITSEGEIAGEVEAESVLLSGRVSNNTIIRAKTLEVKPVADSAALRVTFGDCVLEVGEEPKKSPGSSPVAGSVPAPAAPKPDGGGGQPKPPAPPAPKPPQG